MFRRGERGFTLIDLVMAIAIMGIIMPGIAMTTVGILKNHQKAGDAYIVLQQVQNTGYWIMHDIQAADNVTLGNPNGFPVTLIVPVDTEASNDRKVVYTFDGDKLKRQVYDFSDTLIMEMLIAQYIDMSQTTITSGGLKSYELTARASRNEMAVERSYRIRQRLGAI